MAKKRYVNTREQSFFGNYIYDQVVPENHFLRLLNQLIDWDRFTNRLIELYRGGGEYGRPPFNPTQLLKMGLLAFFYNPRIARSKFMSMRICLQSILSGWAWIKKHPTIQR